MIQFLQRINNILGRIEEVMLSVALLGMIFMAFLQVILRNFFSTSIVWSDLLVRHLVVWIGFMGASLATKQRHHIRLDLLTRVIPLSLKRPVAIFVDLFAAFVSIYLAKAGFDFVLQEKAAGAILFLNVPTWVVQAIIPLCFLFIGFRFLINILFDVSTPGISSEPTPL